MAIQLETIFAFLVLIVSCISLNVVNGKSNVADDPNSNVVEFGDFRDKILTAKQTSSIHSRYSGCNKGHCWKWCNGIDDGKWCFTTKTYAQSYDFVPCTKDSHCDNSLECAGPCRIKSKLKKVLHHLQRLEHIKNRRIQQ